MHINGVEIENTFAEAFKMWGTRLIITAVDAQWALTAAQIMTGFATSVIGCGCEAGIECELAPEETPDGRPGVSVLFFVTSSKAMEKQLLLRVGQGIMTCPTTACYRGLEGEREFGVGKSLRYFGDGFQISKKLKGRRLWRIPVMEGEFLVDETFGMQRSVGGGNLLILGKSAEATLDAAMAAVAAMREVREVVMPFPGGIVRSGSQVGSKYKFLGASTNIAYCPTLKAQVDTALPETVNSVLEIVINGLNENAVREAMRVGIEAACQKDTDYVSQIVRISAGNYGGKLGQYHIHLEELWQ
jgi:formylmethanofuran--tetrahydromethanopterin N-formyltransferase